MVRACSRQMHCVRVLMHAAGMSDARSCRKAWPRSRKSAPTTSRCVTSGGMTRRRASPSQTSRAQVSRASRSGNRSPSRKSSRVCFPVSPAIYLLFLASSFQLLQRAALRPCRPREALWTPLEEPLVVADGRGGACSCSLASVEIGQVVVRHAPLLRASYLSNGGNWMRLHIYFNKTSSSSPLRRCGRLDAA